MSTQEIYTIAGSTTGSSPAGTRTLSSCVTLHTSASAR